MVNKPWLIRSSSRITICYQLCFEKETGTLSTLRPCEASIFNLVPKKCLKNIYEVVALPKIWTKKFEKFSPKYSGQNFSNFSFIFWAMWRLYTFILKFTDLLAHQTSNGMFSRSWRIFWHPWHPWERVNSGVKRILVI